MIALWHNSIPVIPRYPNDIKVKLWVNHIDHIAQNEYWIKLKCLQANPHPYKFPCSMHHPFSTLPSTDTTSLNPYRWCFLVSINSMASLRSQLSYSMGNCLIMFGSMPSSIWSWGTKWQRASWNFGWGDCTGTKFMGPLKRFIDSNLLIWGSLGTVYEIKPAVINKSLYLSSVIYTPPWFCTSPCGVLAEIHLAWTCAD